MRKEKEIGSFDQTEQIKGKAIEKIARVALATGVGLAGCTPAVLKPIETPSSGEAIPVGLLDEEAINSLPAGEAKDSFLSELNSVKEDCAEITGCMGDTVQIYRVVTNDNVFSYRFANVEDEEGLRTQILSVVDGKEKEKTEINEDLLVLDTKVDDNNVSIFGYVDNNGNTHHLLQNIEVNGKDNYFAFDPDGISYVVIAQNEKEVQAYSHLWQEPSIVQAEALPTATIEPTATVVATPTETTVPTPTETLAPTKTTAEETSRYFQPEFQLDLEGSVDGINIPFTIGLHKSIVERAEEPVKTVSVNREDAPDLYAKFWLTICWQKYIQQNPNQAGISFAEYEELVKKGEGEIQVAAVDETTDDQNNKILTFYPENGFVYISVDKSVHLPEDPNTLVSFYLGMNSKGQMVVAENFLWPEILSEQRSYDGLDGWKGSDMVDLIVSDQVATSIQLVLDTDNETLINTTPYWRVAGILKFTDRSLYFDPIIHNIQLSERKPLLTIQK